MATLAASLVVFLLATAKCSCSPIGASDVVALAYHSCVVTVNDQIKCWGRNDYGMLGYEDTAHGSSHSGLVSKYIGLSERVQACAGSLSLHTCVVVASGALKCWGDNNYGQLGIGLTSSYEGGTDAFVELGGGLQAKQVYTGGFATLATLTTGRIKCWGLFSAYCYCDTEHRGNSASSMGDHLPLLDLGTDADAAMTDSSGYLTAVAAHAGWFHACAVLSTGKVKCWGQGEYLGYEDTLDRGSGPGELGNNLPAVNLGVDYTVTQLAVGGEHTCAVLDSKGVKCWGPGSGN
eukprot:2735613-Amphidinium_carterae.1